MRRKKENQKQKEGGSSGWALNSTQLNSYAFTSLHLSSPSPACLVHTLPTKPTKGSCPITFGFFYFSTNNCSVLGKGNESLASHHLSLNINTILYIKELEEESKTSIYRHVIQGSGHLLCSALVFWDVWSRYPFTFSNRH